MNEKRKKLSLYWSREASCEALFLDMCQKQRNCESSGNSKSKYKYIKSIYNTSKADFPGFGVGKLGFFCHKLAYLCAEIKTILPQSGICVQKNNILWPQISKSCAEMKNVMAKN